MDSKASAAANLEKSFEDFQPLAHWVREEDNTIEVHLHDFKKDQLRVQFDNAGNMKISGERPLLEGNKWSRFVVDLRIPKNTYVQAIQAKFVHGVLHVKLPKSIIRTVIKQDQPRPITQTQEPQTAPTSDKRDKPATISFGTLDPNIVSQRNTPNQQGDISANTIKKPNEDMANGEHIGGATSKMTGSREEATNSRWSPPESRRLGFGGLEVSRLTGPKGKTRMSIVLIILSVLVALGAYAAYYKL